MSLERVTVPDIVTSPSAPLQKYIVNIQAAANVVFIAHISVFSVSFIVFTWLFLGTFCAPVLPRSVQASNAT